MHITHVKLLCVPQIVLFVGWYQYSVVVNSLYSGVKNTNFIIEMDKYIIGVGLLRITRRRMIPII